MLLTVRLIRRGVSWLALAVAFYVVVEVFTYEQTYPNLAERQRLATLSDDPAMRMTQGIPHGVDAPGGFVVWDAGWVLAAVVGIWAMLVAGRLLRGEEESGRAELVLAAPVRPARAVAVQIGVLAGAALAVGASAAVPLAMMGTGVAGSMLFGLGLAAFAAVFAAAAAVAAQIFQVRRRVTGVSAAVFGALFLLRMAANSSDARGWLRWLTPFGWLDDIHPYRDPNWTALAVLLAAPVVLGGVAVALRTRRDTARRADHRTGRRPRPAPATRKPGGFRLARHPRHARRLDARHRGVCVRRRRSHRDRARVRRRRPELQAGSGKARLGRGRRRRRLRRRHGHTHRPAHRPVRMLAHRRRPRRGGRRTARSRPRPTRHPPPLAGRPRPADPGVGAAACAGGRDRDVGGAAATSADIGLTDTLAATFNPLPVAALAAGLAVILLGAWPRLTVPGSAAATVTAYLVETIGATLDWPDPILNVSPFHHVASVPAEPFEPVATVIMVTVAVLLIAAGQLLFGHRDLTGD
ncbi:hypothetical protein LUX33_11405 [Actinomadura madurae]|uniref:hypothetical protein n=1 Tax=Actinomadura madurae TaxID=1993 RepID=UPI0020D23D86|nr:hypothetical protein [Actinomadura madurae]MCP9948954.1 hypothetical protein [Actinomadura madurae]